MTQQSRSHVHRVQPFQEDGAVMHNNDAMQSFQHSLVSYIEWIDELAGSPLMDIM